MKQSSVIEELRESCSKQTLLIEDLRGKEKEAVDKLSTAIKRLEEYVSR